MLNNSSICSLKIEEFKNIIENSKNWTEVMTYFKDNHGYKNISHGSTAKKRCIRENIDFSHFTTSTKPNKKTLDEILTKDSNTHNGKLKHELYKNKLLEEKCYHCNLGNIWNGKLITLQLEHINGDHFDNRIENLTILCPNCHSQTDTWCSKNPDKIKKKCLECNVDIKNKSTHCAKCYEKNCAIIRKTEKVEIIKKTCCEDCDEEISYGAKRCVKCYNLTKKDDPLKKDISLRKVQDRPSLEQIIIDYEELKSMIKVGEKYGVSDNAVNKWIKQYDNAIKIREFKKSIKNKCIDCGTEILKRSKRCAPCHVKTY
jgi:hypothetical protein